MEHISTLLADPVTVLQSMTLLKGEESKSQLDEDISRLRSEIKNLVNQEKRYLKAYALGELDDDFIKTQSGPVKARMEQAQIELENLESQRRSTHFLENVRDSLEDNCKLVKENIDSLGFEERRLGIEALDITAKVSDDQVEVNAVGESDSRLSMTN